MIITKTPFRMSFFGGGTDFSGFFNEHGGAVLSTTFDKYAYVTVRNLPPFFEYKTHLTYSKEEKVNSVDEIQHPAIRNAMKWLGMEKIRMTYEADLPARSGLGTSSSFAVGMLEAFYALKGKYADKKKLSDDAIYLERTLCAEAGGIQDQIAAAFGGFNRIDFSKDGYTVNPVVMSRERKKELNDNIMLFFTGFSRFSSDIQKGTEKSMKEKTKELLEIYSLVDEAQKILSDNNADLDEFGKLLDYSWNLKRGISEGISTDSIDEQYKKAMDAGALGGKLLGAGGGGFLLFYVPKEKQKSVKNALKDQMQVPFSFENEGTRIIYYAADDNEEKI
ncbi:MAG: GHMP family kinase ATP-binding protein [Treponema sp.]